MGDIMKRAFHAGIMLLFSFTLTLGLVPATAFASGATGWSSIPDQQIVAQGEVDATSDDAMVSAGHDVADDARATVSRQTNSTQPYGAGQSTMTTLVQAYKADAMVGFFDFASIDRGPFTKDDLGDPTRRLVTLTTINGIGNPEDYIVRWERHLVDENGGETLDVDFPVQGGGGVAVSPSNMKAERGEVDGSVMFTYDLGADAFAGDQRHYRYYVTVEDSASPRNTITTLPVYIAEGQLVGQPIDVMPGENRYSDDLLTDTGLLGDGEWSWRFSGTHFEWGRLNADGLSLTSEVFGVLSNQAIKDGLAVCNGASANGPAAWILSLTTDGEKETDMFVGRARVTLDAAAWLDDFPTSDGTYASEADAKAAAVEAASKLRLLRTMDGRSVQTIGWAGEAASASDVAFQVDTVVIDGKVHAWLTFTVQATTPRETGRLGCIALAGPASEDQVVVAFRGLAKAASDDVALPADCWISPTDEQLRSPGQKMQYEIGVADGWKLKRYVVSGFEVIAGDASGSDMRPALIEVAQSHTEAIGTMGSNILVIDVDKLIAAWRAVGKDFASDEKVSVVAQFEKRELSADLGVKGPVLEIPAVDHGYVEITYFAAVLGEDGMPEMNEDGEITLVEKQADTKSGIVKIDDIMPGTRVTLKFCPAKGEGQFVTGYDAGGTFVRGNVLVTSDGACGAMALTNDILQLPNYGIGDDDQLIKSSVAVEYRFGPGQDEPRQRYTVRTQIAPGSDDAIHGAAFFQGTNDTQQGGIEAGSRVAIDIRPDEVPAPGYVLDKVIMIQHAVDVNPNDVAGTDVTAHVTDGTLTVDVVGVKGKGDVITFLFHFKVAPVTITIPEGLGAGADGQSLGEVVFEGEGPRATRVIDEGGTLVIEVRPASGCELNPAAQLVLRGSNDKSMVITMAQLEEKKGFDVDGNPVFKVPVSYADAVGLGGRVELAVQEGPLFREKSDEPGPTPKPELEVSVVEANVEIVDVQLGVTGGVVPADFDACISVDVAKQRVKYGGSVSFVLTLKDVKGDKGYFALYDIISKAVGTGNLSGKVSVTPMRDASSAARNEGDATGGTLTQLQQGSALVRSGLVASPAGAYLVMISDVRADLSVEVQIAEMDPSSADPEIREASTTPPSKRGLPDWFTLTATSDGGGYVLPLFTSSNAGVAEGERPGMKVFDLAGDAAARYVEFSPFEGHYLKSVYVQQGSYVDGKWVGSKGDVGKCVNVFWRVSDNRLDVREVFDALGVGRGVHVRLLAKFAETGAEKETVDVTWGGAFAKGADGMSGAPLECKVTPSSLDKVGAVVSLPMNGSQTFTFAAAPDPEKAPHGWMLDYVLVNGQKREPLPNQNSITLPMNTDMELVVVFRPAEEGEKPEPSKTHPITSEQPSEGGSVLIGGSKEPMLVIVGDSQTIDLVPDDPTKDYAWILDEVTFDDVRLVPWGDVATLPEGWTFDPMTGEGTTVADERFKIDYAHGTLTIDNVMGPHHVGAKFARAVDLRVVCDADDGLVTPRGEFKWRVEVQRGSDGLPRVGADGREVLVPDKLTVYTAPYEGSQLVAFDVNGEDEMGSLAVPSDGEEALEKLKREHAALQGGIGSGVSAGSSAGSAGSGAHWATLATNTDVKDEPSKENVPAFGEIRAYDLTADDLTRDGRRVTTVEASFGALQDDAETYAIEASVLGGHGKVNGQDKVTISAVRKGGMVHLRFSPDAGYVVKQVRDNKQVRTDFTDTGYTIANVQEDHEVEVVFGLPGTPGSNDGVSRVIRQIAAMIKTGDLALPMMFVALAVALSAAGVAVFVSSKRRKKS